MIYSINKLNSNENIIMSCSDINPWELNCHVTIIDNNDNIIKKYKLPTTRICYGFITNKNMFIFIHCKHIDYKVTNIIEFYKVDDKYNIVKVNEYTIPTSYSCNNIIGRVCSYENNHTLIWGDLVNYNYCDYVIFNDTICSDINHIHDVDYNIEICFTINENIIMESDVIAFSEKYFSLKIHSQHENNSCYIKKIELPFTHRFKKVTEIDSIICKLVYNANNLICLLRVKLYRNIDVLHIEIYFVDILIDITNNKVIEVSDIILNKGDLEFGILPSIDYPNIWNKRIDIDL
jgi:hypothetical protein